MIVRMINTKDVFKTYFVMNRKCVMWAAQAYTTKKHSTKRRLWAVRGVWRCGKGGRK